MYRQSNVKAGPPQIKAADFQPRLLRTSFWLRQEMKNAGLLVPCMRTVGGRGSKSWGATPGAGAAEAPAAILLSTPAAAQAAGLVIPALTRAAAIFPCCVISAALLG